MGLPGLMVTDENAPGQQQQKVTAVVSDLWTQPPSSTPCCMQEADHTTIAEIKAGQRVRVTADQKWAVRAGRCGTIEGPGGDDTWKVPLAG